MLGTSIVQKYYTLVNERVKMRKRQSSKYKYQVHANIFSLHKKLNSAYVIDHLHGASVKVNCPVGDLKSPIFCCCLS